MDDVPVADKHHVAARRHAERARRHRRPAGFERPKLSRQANRPNEPGRCGHGDVVHARVVPRRNRDVPVAVVGADGAARHLCSGDDAWIGQRGDVNDHEPGGAGRDVRRVAIERETAGLTAVSTRLARTGLAGSATSMMARPARPSDTKAVDHAL